MNAASYYADLTEQYQRYAGAARGWHHGLWEPDVRTHQQALLRSNERLLRDLPIDRSTRVLDVGCGIGGFAAWAAKHHGCHVTGITVCAEHVGQAADAAAAAGVGAQCSFQLMDMDRLTLAPETFDYVVNQETLCHAANKAQFLRGVYDALKPGGTWRAVDFNVHEPVLSTREHHEYDVVCEGFHIPSMARGSEVRRWLQDAGFVDVVVEDATPLVLPTAKLIIRMCYLPLLMARLRLDWAAYSFDPVRRRNRRGHVAAGYAYGRGLQTGYFKHLYFSARKPR